MAVSKIPKPFSGKWAYLGSTTGANQINIPSSKYTDIYCIVYLRDNSNYAFSFFLMTNYIDARTYKQGMYINASDYYYASIHNDTSGNWWGWSAGQNGEDVMSTTKFYWFAR